MKSFAISKTSKSNSKEEIALMNSRIIHFVFRPLVWYMRMSGFSVPMECSHGPSTTRRRTPNQIKAGGTSVFHRTPVSRHFSYEEARTRKSKRTNAVEVTQTELKRNERAKSPQQRKSNPTERGSTQTFRRTNLTDAEKKSTKCKQLASSGLNKTVNVVDVDKRVNQRNNPKKGTKRGRASMGKPDQQSHNDHALGWKEYVEGFTEILESQSCEISGLDPEVSEVEEKDDRSRRCFRCAAISLCTRLHCGFICLLLVLNAVRYTSIFYIVDSSYGANLITAVTFQSFFVGVAIMYILSAYDVARLSPRIVENVEKYERTYGTAIDLEKFNKIVVSRVRFYNVLQASFAVGVVVLQQFVFPSLRRHLAPFHNASGVAFYCSLAVFALVLYFISAAVYALFGFMVVMTVFLSKEFKNIGKEFEDLFKGTNPAGLYWAQKRHPEKPRASTSPFAELNGSSNSDLLHQRSNTRPSDDEVKAPLPILTIDDVEEEAGESENPLHVNINDTSADTVTANLNHATNPSIQTVPKLIDRAQCSNPFREGCLSSTAVASDDNQSSALNSGSILHPNQPQEDTDDKGLHQEALFDMLRMKHQALCDLVTTSNHCIRHFVSFGVAGGVPLLCLIIFTLQTRDLDLADASFQTFNLLFALIYLVIVIVLGVHLNESAHAPQEVIYAADWSKFSDRLLQKVQLFANRLGHVQIGYDVYGLIVIDRSTVLMIVGTLLTYTVVVIQFQQGEVTLTTGENSTILK